MQTEQKSEDEQRLEYCRKYNIHHLFELLATKVLVERPANPFAYLREMLTRVEESEKHKNSYDATRIHFYDEEAEQQEEETEEQEQQQENLEENKCNHEEAKQSEQLHEIDNSNNNEKNAIVANGSANTNSKKE